MHTSNFERSLGLTWVSKPTDESRGHSHHLFAQISEIFNDLNENLHLILFYNVMLLSEHAKTKYIRLRNTMTLLLKNDDWV